MGKVKDLITAEKNEVMSTSEISKEYCRGHRPIKKPVEKITKLWIRSKWNDFKNLLPWDKHKQNQFTVERLLLPRAQIFENTRIEGVTEDKRCRILCEFGSVNKTFWQFLTKAFILNCQNWAKKYMNIDLSKVIFTVKSWVKFDGHDIRAKRRIVSNSDIPKLKDGNKEVSV